MRIIREGNRNEVAQAKLEVLRARAIGWSRAARCGSCGKLLEVEAADIVHVEPFISDEYFVVRCPCKEIVRLHWLPGWIKKLARSGALAAKETP